MMDSTPSSDECSDECDFMEYVTDVTTTKVSDSFIQFLTQGLHDPAQNNFVGFTVYYRTFDVTQISYHGKVTKKKYWLGIL